MEVLKTSEELEKQILEDARKKASRLLEAADKECAQIRAEWQHKGEEETARLCAELETKLSAMREELQQSLPLDFMRIRLSTLEEKLRAAMHEVLGAFNPSDVIEVIGTMIHQAATILSGKSVVAFVGGLDGKEAEKLLKEKIPGVKVEGIKAIEESGYRRTTSADSSVAATGMIIETTDRKMRFRGTLGDLEHILLEDYRSELVTALFGKDI